MNPTHLSTKRDTELPAACLSFLTRSRSRVRLIGRNKRDRGKQLQL